MAVRKKLDPALMAKLGIKTLAQVEAGEVAKPDIHGVYQDGGNVYQGPIDCPVEDVPTVSWLERLTAAYRKRDEQQEYEPLQALLWGKKLPSGFMQMPLPKQVAWLDANHPIEEVEF